MCLFVPVCACMRTCVCVCVCVCVCTNGLKLEFESPAFFLGFGELALESIKKTLGTRESLKTAITTKQLEIF